MHTRRHFLAATVGAGLTPLIWPAHSGAADGRPAFDFETVKEEARKLAAAPFNGDFPALPDPLRELDYEQYGEIRFDPGRALWKGQCLFEAQFFHRGFRFDRPVALHTVENGLTQTIAYDKTMFDYGGHGFRDELPSDLGFAGFRLHYPVNTPAYADEVAVFLGASYFRLLGRDQHFGASARGLAIDTAMPSGEEFPFFRAFWLEKPAPDASAVTFYALLDSESCAGAYRFAIYPGEATVQHVEATLFPRDDIQKPGIAPLTSMFMFGENGGGDRRDYRPEVHDSDGLLVNASNGEWIWRPLTNPRQLQVSAFLDQATPRGFGLMQRDRAFTNYQDLDLEYQKRPSFWVEPLGDWGPGRIELVEIPSDDENNDNIVAYWVPERPVKAGEPFSFAYRLHADKGGAQRPPSARAIATRIDRRREKAGFIVDFEGGELPSLAADQPVEATVTAATGKIRNTVVRKNRETGGWRVAFDFRDEDAAAADLRCFLHMRGAALSETWSYLWKP